MPSGQRRHSRWWCSDSLRSTLPPIWASAPNATGYPRHIPTAAVDSWKERSKHTGLIRGNLQMINSGPIICYISTQETPGWGQEQGRREGRPEFGSNCKCFPQQRRHINRKGGRKTTFTERQAWAQVPAISLITCESLIDCEVSARHSFPNFYLWTQQPLSSGALLFYSIWTQGSVPLPPPNPSPLSPPQ